MEAALVNMDHGVLEITEDKANSLEDAVRRCALAYAKAVGRHEAVLEFGKQSERLNRLWIRLHAKLKELQNDRKSRGTRGSPGSRRAAETKIEKRTRRRRNLLVSADFTANRSRPKQNRERERAGIDAKFRKRT